MKKVIRGIAFLIIAVMVIIQVFSVLKWKDTNGDYLSSTRQLYATEKDLMDIVFMGSSHCYCGIVPDVLWGDYGYAAFNMTISGQDKASTYYHLKELLKNQSPKIVCVELWGLTYDKHAVEGNVHRNLMAMNLSKNAIGLIQAYADEEEQMDYILRWPIVHTRYKELKRYDFVPYEYSEYGRGVELSYQIGWSAFPSEAVACEEVGELTVTNKEWLENLYRVSEEEDFELVLFFAPTMVDVEQQKQVNAAKKFAEERGIDFFDFNRLTADVGLDYSRDFIDQTHLNGYGAEKLTRYLGTYIEQKYPLDDHRGDEAYEQWEKSYTHYERTLQAGTLLSISDPASYFTILSELKDFTYLVSFDGNYKQSTLDLAGYAQILGLTEEQYEKGGTFLFKDGEITHLLDNESEEIVIYELNECDALKIQNMELVKENAGALNDVMLNMESVGSIYTGLNVVVYDDFKKRVIDKKGYY